MTVCDEILQNSAVSRDLKRNTTKGPTTRKSLSGLNFAQMGDCRMFPADNGH